MSTENCRKWKVGEKWEKHSHIDKYTKGLLSSDFDASGVLQITKTLEQGVIGISCYDYGTE